MDLLHLMGNTACHSLRSTPFYVRVRVPLLPEIGKAPILADFYVVSIFLNSVAIRMYFFRQCDWYMTAPPERYNTKMSWCALWYMQGICSHSFYTLLIKLVVLSPQINRTAHVK